MRYRALLAIAAIVATSSASRLDGQVMRHNFWTQCLAAPFQACATLDVSLIYHTSGDFASMTEMQWRVSNEQGPESPVRGLKGIDLYGLRSSLDFLAMSRVELTATEGNVQVPGSNPMDMATASQMSSGVWSTTLRWDMDSFLFGCNVPTGASPFAGYDATCKGALTYSIFVAALDLSLLEDVSARFTWNATGDQFSGANFGPSGRCTTGVDCVMVTPEPATLALMATGLAGLAGIRARRRRKEASGKRA